MTAHPRAVAAYASARGLSQRAAEDELLRIAGFGHVSEDGRRIRYRSRADELDVTMNLDGGVIIAVSVRGYRGGGGGSTARRRAERIARRKRERGEE